jgi:hypothetical protein
MDNQRKLKRRELLYNLKIYDAETNEIVGRAVDITVEGLKVTGTASIAIDKRCELSMELPETISGKKKIRFSAQVKWCRPDVNTRFTAIGMQFTALAPEDEEILFSLMTQYVFPE